MRLLFLSITFPLPLSNGNKLRTWALLRALAEEGHEVTLLAFQRPIEVSPVYESQVRAVCTDLKLVPLSWSNLSTTGDVTGRLRTLMTSHPYAVERFASETMRGRIHACLDKGQFNAIVSDVFMA